MGWRDEPGHGDQSGPPWHDIGIPSMAAELVSRGWIVARSVPRAPGLWGGFDGVPSVLIARELERRLGEQLCERPDGADQSR
jgi:hypothetical protein